jgi:hypothetical protein
LAQGRTFGALAHLARRLGFEVRRIPRTRVCSNLDEQQVIARYVAQRADVTPYVVDIGASDGVTMSNTFALFREGWEGLAVEFGATEFAALARHYAHLPRASLARAKVTPLNVLALLRAHSVPTEFGVLSLDIDGYDHFVLAEILKEFRPFLICAEVNEKIPPPVKFTVLWNPEYAWRTDHFFGQSLSQLHTLCESHQYALVELQYNNAFLIPVEKSPVPGLTPEAAYDSGYRARPDRAAKFPWNADMEPLLSMPPERAVEFLHARFADRAGEFLCHL